jgi:poly(A)-specific ribonuclease
MDINGSNYWGSLPVVLEAIAKASYVAIDLEMTGVKTKDLSTSSKPTLEDVYDQAKRAAEKFQIVQFGLTCITYHKTAKGRSKHHPLTGMTYRRVCLHQKLTVGAEYRTENFNFSITPSVVGTAPIDGTLARIVDRYIGFSSSSMLFLKQNHFNMESAFKNGIPYLSKEEIELLKRKFLQPYGWVDPNHKVNLTDYDQEAIDFYNYALGLIHTWYDSKFREVRAVLERWEATD